MVVSCRGRPATVRPASRIRCALFFAWVIQTFAEVCMNSQDDAVLFAQQVRVPVPSWLRLPFSVVVVC